MDNCLFCNIIVKKIPAKFLYESEKVVVIPDIHPAADVHLLIVPREHIRGIGEISESTGGLLTNVYEVANKLIKMNNLVGNAYRVLVNGGKAQHVPHLHFHLLGGKWYKFV